MKTIILISGKQGAGKSTLAKGLASKLSDRTTHAHLVKFADPLYEMHKAIRGILQSYKSDNLDANKIDGPLLQLLGTEWGRKTRGDDIWVDVAKARVELMHTLHNPHRLFARSIFIFDDARFENEIKAFDNDEDPDTRVFRIRLTAPEATRKTRADKWRDNTDHPSEIGLDGFKGWDIVVDTAVHDPKDVLNQIAQFIELTERR